MLEEKLDKETFAKLRDAGELLTLTDSHNGKTCPAYKTLLKCAKSSILCMVWNPIGKWDTLDNGVLKLASRECYLTIYKAGGFQIKLNYSQGDFRYSTDDYITSYLAKVPQFGMTK